jgi:putative DNA primase/helicase
LTATPIDFVGLARALLDRVESLLSQWLPNGFKRNGYWYVGDFDGSPGKSANVKLSTGQWMDNAHPADHGGDLISLYARIRGLTQVEAARDLMRDNGWMAAPVQAPKPKKKTAQWMPIHPVPTDAPDYKTQWAHVARGVPKQHWEYRDRAGQLLGVVTRFDKSDGTKDVQPLSFCQSNTGVRMWRYKAFVEPRPLYGLWRLPAEVAAPGDDPASRPLAIVVEGEKKADRLFEALGAQIPVLGWPGGCKVPHLADWAPLQPFRVVCWPDADAQRDKASGELFPLELQPGMLAMRKIEAILAAQGTPARVVDVGAPGERPAGWDAADAVEEGWTRQDLMTFMARFVSAPGQAPADAAPAEPVDTAGGAPAQPPGAKLYLLPGTSPPTAAAPGEGAGAERAKRNWRADYVRARGEPRECVPNVMLVMAHHPEWQGVLGFDEFSQRVVKRRPAPYQDDGLQAVADDEWTDVDDTRAVAWIARHEGWVVSSSMVAEAVNVVARAHPFHPVLEWLRSLKHDGTPRLDDWMIDHLGVEDNEYVRLVSRYFVIGMCMRVLEPGCKFDTCLVLEGPQGRRKSMALRVLGGEWFSDIELDLQNKDAMSNIRGKWLHEFGEMGSLARAESNRQKSFLSRQIDEFRPVYGRREIRCKRQSAFGGTTNEWQWNKDPTGGRRFWPVEVGTELNIEGLAAMREQLFAEAFACAQAHIADRSTHRYWPTDVEQRELFDPEQLAREAPDAYLDLLASWINGDKCDPTGRGWFTLAEALMSGVNLDTKGMTKDVQSRVGICLRKLGCEKVERRTAQPRFVYKRPQRNAASSQTNAGPDNAMEVPF